MLIYLQSDLKKRIRLSLIMDLANDSIGSSECRDSTSSYCIKMKRQSSGTFKRPLRDACLCMGELQAPPAPPAPHFVFLITL